MKNNTKEPVSVQPLVDVVKALVRLMGALGIKSKRMNPYDAISLKKPMK